MRLRGGIDHDAPPVGRVAHAPHVPDPFQAVDDDRDGGVGELALVGEPSGGHWSGAAENVEAAQVGPVDAHVCAGGVVDRLDGAVVDAKCSTDFSAQLLARGPRHYC
jgi:hypothetical protein